MPTPARVLLVLASVLAAGCTAATDADAPSEKPAAEALLDAVAMDGATVAARDEASVTLRWEGSLEATTVTPTGQRIFFGDDVVGALALPVGAFLAVDLAASARAPLTVDLLDADGTERCDVQSATLAPCLPLVRIDAAEDAAWQVQVFADGTVEEGEPFALEARVRLVEPPGGGLPALAAEADADRLAFRAPVLVEDIALHEPSLDVTPAGVIYVSGYANEPGLLWRSTDGGASFARVPVTDAPYCNNPVDALVPAPRLPGDEGAFHWGCGDIDVAVSGEEHVYFAHHWNGEAVHASHDGGKTWTTSLAASNEPRLTDRAWLAANGQEAWLAFNSGRRATPSHELVGDTVVSRTTDGGRTWLQVGQTPGSCIPGSFVHSPATGALHLGTCGEEGPAVTSSSDGGLTWDWRLIAPRSGDEGGRICYTCALFTVLDVDDAGNLYAAWSDPSEGGTFDVWYATSRDAGATWTDPLRVNGAGGTHVMPWLVAGSEGHAALAWYATAYEGAPHEAEEAVWYLHVAETFDGLADAPTFSEAAASATPVQYGPICLGGAACERGRNLGDYLQVAFDPDERPVVAYADGRGGGAWNAQTRVLVVTSSRP